MSGLLVSIVLAIIGLVLALFVLKWGEKVVNHEFVFRRAVYWTDWFLLAGYEFLFQLFCFLPYLFYVVWRAIENKSKDLPAFLVISVSLLCLLSAIIHTLYLRRKAKIAEDRVDKK